MFFLNQDTYVEVVVDDGVLNNYFLK